MVQRTNLIDSVGVIAALLLPLTIDDSTCMHTKPMALGLFAEIFSNISFFANVYSLMGTLTGSWWAVIYEVYGDVIRPIIGLVIAFVSLLIEKLLCNIIDAYEFNDTTITKSTGKFIAWMVPFVITVIAIFIMTFQQQSDARIARAQRLKEGLSMVDKEDRRDGDPFNSFSTKLDYRMVIDRSNASRP